MVNRLGLLKALINRSREITGGLVEGDGEVAFAMILPLFFENSTIRASAASLN
jgi:hypothetical protein